ncbi:ARHGAP44 [Bugula neritina]|uniref:ARHGAP44 n=1 Tax=Bugula neritina TaxID=10212 RepID=A0A7J7IWF9_BUGNE|nr:ARHGAP44 [Bugula neritina]
MSNCNVNYFALVWIYNDKNILRVKQRADQGLGRAEKTEVLSEDLLLAEKKVEALKNVLQTLVKKLTASLQAHNVHDQEKRAKKMPIVHLATSLEESSKVLGEGMLCDVLRQCSMGMNSIGYAQQFYELTVEGSILSYIQEILDTDVPAIKKSKQQLTKLTLDMDSTRSRQQSAAQSSSHSSHSQSKTELLNVELEEAEQKVATCRDQYTTEIFQLLSKESDICLKIIEV